MPDCWVTVNGSGNRVSWSRTSGHASRWAEKVVVRKYSSGDVTLLSDPICAPAMGPGTVEVGVWYVADTTTRFVVQVRDASGSWSTVPVATTVPRAGSWTRVTARVDLPAGTTAVRFGLALRSKGQLVTDDYSLVVL